MSTILIYTDDIETEIKIPVPVEKGDLTKAEKVEIKVQKPNGEDVTLDAKVVRRGNFFDVIHPVEKRDIDMLGIGRFPAAVSAKMPGSDEPFLYPIPTDIILEIAER